MKKFIISLLLILMTTISCASIKIIKEKPKNDIYVKDYSTTCEITYKVMYPSRVYILYIKVGKNRYRTHVSRRYYEALKRNIKYRCVITVVYTYKKKKKVYLALHLRKIRDHYNNKVYYLF